jgi:hypothetical protein
MDARLELAALLSLDWALHGAAEISVSGLAHILESFVH